MVRILHAQTVLTEEDLNQLKKKTGEDSTKEALATAVRHYLECERTDIDVSWQKKMEALVQKKNRSPTPSSR